MEICVDNVLSAIEAEKGGASRIELCSNLAEGGTTPSLGLFLVVKGKLKIPIFVMIRPRGGDFLYSYEEFQVMIKEIEVFKSHAADGFVFGILTQNAKIDIPRCKHLRELCSPAPATFHRAFDMVLDPNTALNDVIEIGFERLLTSGLDSTALEGLDTLRTLVEKAGNRITIVPGGGINSRNLERILKVCGAKEFHCSARSTINSGMLNKNTHVHMGAAYYAPEYSIKVTDSNIAKCLIDIAEKILTDK